VHVDAVVAVLPLLVIVGGLAGAAWWHVRRGRRLRDGLLRLAVRDGLRPTATPCGLAYAELAGRSAATPRGDRSCGLRFGVEAPAPVELAGRTVQVHLAAFEWWYEVRVRHGKTSSYQRRTNTVAVARLPGRIAGHVAIRPERLLGRVGVTRGDQQLESEEFNRRFHVAGSDEQLTLRLLDAAMQHRLVTSFTGRSVDLRGDLVVLGGQPDHRDGSLPGVIGELPAVVQDLRALLRAVPAGLWRAANPLPGRDAGGAS
jgi:hypothetical protein